MTNKAIHWLRHVRGCRSIIREDILRARRIEGPVNGFDCIELTLKSEELVENLFALEFRTSAPDHSQIQLKKSPTTAYIERSQGLEGVD